ARRSGGCRSTRRRSRSRRQRALRRRDGAAEARIDRRRHVARPRERLEDALDRVVRVAAVVQQHVQVALRAGGERREELLRELAVEVADPLAVEAGDVPHERRPAAEIDRHRDHHLVHRQGRPAVARDAGAVAERALERGPEHEAHVLDGVVAVDLDVAGRAQLQVEHAVARERVEHVRQERQRRLDRARAGPVEGERELNLRFLRVSLDRRGARHASLYQLGTDRTNKRMVRHLRVIACVLLPVGLLCLASVSLAACRGGKKAPKDPVIKDAGKKKPPEPPETEEEREKKRQAAIKQLIPEGTNCLPDTLKGGSAPRLELAAINGEAVICAVDHERDRLLGVIACWKVEVTSGDLEYTKPVPIPSRGYPVKLEDRCARGYCLPKDAKADAKIAHMVWSPDASKVAVNVGDEIYLFDAASKARESNFSIRGDKGVSSDPIQLYWVADSIFVEGSDGAATSPVWVFKAADGTQMGALEAIGKAGKPLSTHGGSFVILDENRVAISEQGFSSLITYEVASGKRAKVVRKLPKTPCKAEETDAYWTDSLDKVSAKCKEFMGK